MDIITPDLSDAHEDATRPCETQFRQYGARKRFAGAIRTVRCRGDNLLIRQMLETPSAGEVLIVDGGGSLAAALVGDMLAEKGRKSGWSGVVIFGAVRDTPVLAGMDFGVKALGTNPRRGTKLGAGATDVPVTFGGVTFTPGQWVYSDDDGILVAPQALQ